MGDLDISLIMEFARRPGFYDRSNPNFKDKAYIQQAWSEISHQLGYDAHLLKDRMYQLRNRYNLEKRRLENIRNNDPSNPVRSPWPLFSHLTFLDGHIRPRRSYKRMMRRRMAETHVNSNCNVTVIPSANMIMNNGTNGVMNEKQYQVKHPDVKYETECETEEEQEASEANGSHFIDASNFLADDSDGAASESRSNFPNIAQSPPNNEKVNAANGVVTVTNGINVRNIETLRRDLSIDDSNLEHPPPKKQAKISRFEKFEAFGKFLSISLCDLSEQKALSLVEKFTSDVVKALLENN